MLGIASSAQWGICSSKVNKVNVAYFVLDSIPPVEFIKTFFKCAFNTGFFFKL